MVGNYFINTPLNLTTDPKCTTMGPNIKLGTSSGMYSIKVMAQCVRFVRDYSLNTPAACNLTKGVCYNYLSPYILHARVTGLAAGQTYYYVVGDSAFTSAEKTFSTLPTAKYPFVMVSIADLGQTVNSTATRNGILALTGDMVPDVVTLTGDFSYADDYSASHPEDVNLWKTISGSGAQPRWDTFVKLMEPLFSAFPVIHVAGNHEIEAAAGCFLSSNGVYWYPNNPATNGAFTTITWPTTDFSTTNPCFQSYNYRFPHPFTTTWGDLSGPSHYYGVSYGPVHIVSLNHYLPFGAGTPQYLWFLRHMQTIDRSKTPWLFVQLHAGVYHTYFTHYKELECLLSIYEPLFLNYGVDVVLSGHVHAYERTHPVYQYQLNPCGPIYLAIGDGGNIEGPYRKGVEEKLDPTGVKSNLTYCDMLPTAPPTGTNYFNPAFSPLDQGVTPLYQYAANPANCPATSWQTPYGVGGETTGLVQNRQDGTRYFCQRSQPKWSAYRDPSFGFSHFTIHNDTSVTFRWRRNIDGNQTWADTTTITRPPPGQCTQEGPPAAPPTCSSSTTESCCTRPFSNPSSNTLTVDFQRTVRITSVTMWNDPASTFGAPPLYQSQAQLAGFDLSLGEGGSSSDCYMDPMAPPPPAKGGYAGMTLACDTGSTLTLAAPGLAQSTAQQQASLYVRICIANSVVGPRNVSLYLESQ